MTQFNEVEQDASTSSAPTTTNPTAEGEEATAATRTLLHYFGNSAESLCQKRKWKEEVANNTTPSSSFHNHVINDISDKRRKTELISPDTDHNQEEEIGFKSAGIIKIGEDYDEEEEEDVGTKLKIRGRRKSYLSYDEEEGEVELKICKENSPKYENDSEGEFINSDENKFGELEMKKMEKTEISNRGISTFFKKITKSEYQKDLETKITTEALIHFDAKKTSPKQSPSKSQKKRGRKKKDSNVSINGADEIVVIENPPILDESRLSRRGRKKKTKVEDDEIENKIRVCEPNIVQEKDFIHDSSDNIRRSSRISSQKLNRQNSSSSTDEVVVIEEVINKNPHKLASIFTKQNKKGEGENRREDPKVVFARKSFLFSKDPSMSLTSVNKKPGKNEFSTLPDFFNDFSQVSHFNYHHVHTVTEDRFTTRPRSSTSLELDLMKIEEYMINGVSLIPEPSKPPGKRLEPLNKDEMRSLKSFNIIKDKKLAPIVLDDTHSSRMWTLKYSPSNSSEILGNSDVISNLRDWFDSFTLQSRSQDDDDDSDDEDSRGSYMSSASSTTSANNAVLLYGPHGSGKTSSIYALASEFDYQILEVNASSTRGGRQVTAQTHEATQSHRVQHKSNQSRTLILFEDVDVIFDELDDGFYQAVASLILRTKRPVVLTYTSARAKRIPIPKIDRIQTFQFRLPNPDDVINRLRMIALSEGFPVSNDSLENIVSFNGSNISKCISDLQFYLLSAHRHDLKREEEKEDLPKLHIPFKHKKVAKDKQNRRKLYPLTETLNCEPPKPKLTASRPKIEDVLRMEELANNLSARLCPFYEDDNDHHQNEDYYEEDHSYFDRIKAAEDDLLSAIAPTEPKGTPYVLDVFPVLRFAARHEEKRRISLNVGKRSRRFIHYFDVQLNLHLPQETLYDLCNCFQGQ